MRLLIVARKFYLSPLLIFLFAQCTILRPITEPTQSILRRGSCIAFDIPSITLTPSQTAVERQLLGEEVKIEPDGWLITSSQSDSRIALSKKESSLSSNDNTQNLSELRRHYIEKGVLKYYEKSVTDYLSKHVLGECADGKIRLVPRHLSHRSVRVNRSSARKIATELNRARSWLYRYHFNKQRSAILKISDNELRKIKAKYLQIYYTQAQQRSQEWTCSLELKWFLTP